MTGGSNKREIKSFLIIVVADDSKASISQRKIQKQRYGRDHSFAVAYDVRNISDG